MRQYRTQSGVYNEADLAVVVWVNPRQKSSKQARSLETMTSEDSTLPMAFPLHALASHRSWKNASIVRNAEDIYKALFTTERSRPLVVPLPLAGDVFDWHDFYIPSEYLFESM